MVIACKCLLEAIRVTTESRQRESATRSSRFSPVFLSTFIFILHDGYAMVCICLMIFFGAQPHWLNLACQTVILATTVYSGVEYFVKNWDVFRES